MSNKRVLVVDDNETNLKLVTHMLGSERYDVSTASSAGIALERLRESKFDLLLLDLQLPDMDGLELTRVLRADPTMADLPIVAVTAYAMKGDEEKARSAGVDSYVTKPIAKDEFRGVVAKMLRGGRDMNREHVHAPGTASAASAREIVTRYRACSVAEHPLFVELAREPVDLSAIWLLMANLRVGISKDFVVWLARTVARVDDRRIGSLVAKQLDDELGHGDFGRIHSLLLDKFVEALAPSRIRGPDAWLLAAGRQLSEDAQVPFYAVHPYESVGALIAGEIFANKMDCCVGDQIRRQAGLSPQALTWLTIHETLEADHAEDAGEIAALVPRDEDVLAATWRGATTLWDALYRFLDRVQQIRCESALRSQRS